MTPHYRTSAEVCRSADITYRQLSHWVGCGWIAGQPERIGSGIPRRWADEHVSRVIEIRDALREAQAILLGAGLASWERAHVALIGNVALGRPS